MIPWFIVDIAGWIAERFGYQVYVRARSHAWGADHLFFIYNPDAERLPKLKAPGEGFGDY